MSRINIFAVVTSLGLSLLGTTEPGIAADDQQLDRLLALCKPGKADRLWNAIAWKTSLWEARVEAARQGKPILLWQMDGHPLGCV